MKQAFLFSCLTGMRWSDINKLTWGEVQEMDGHTRILFRQKKTKGFEYLDISDQAVKYLGERGKPNERVFLGLKYSAWHNQALEKWCMKAGILKDITFHMGNHSKTPYILNTSSLLNNFRQQVTIKKQNNAFRIFLSESIICIDCNSE